MRRRSARLADDKVVARQKIRHAIRPADKTKTGRIVQVLPDLVQNRIQMPATPSHNARYPNIRMSMENCPEIGFDPLSSPSGKIQDTEGTPGCHTILSPRLRCTTEGDTGKPVTLIFSSGTSRRTRTSRVHGSVTHHISLLLHSHVLLISRESVTTVI